jgi:hypothetical protein
MNQLASYGAASAMFAVGTGLFTFSRIVWKNGARWRQENNELVDRLGSEGFDSETKLSKRILSGIMIGMLTTGAFSSSSGTAMASVMFAILGFMAFAIGTFALLGAHK